MNILKIILEVLLVLSSFFLIMSVLLHKGKGGGLSDMFGGGISSSAGSSGSPSATSTASPSAWPWCGP